MRRPEADEFAEYYGAYVAAVPDGDVLEILRQAPDDLEGMLVPVRPEQEQFSYAPGKWTIREVLGHVLDTERLFVGRALSFARGDTGPLPGMDQDQWAAQSNAGSRPVADLLAEFADLRRANTRWFASLDEDALQRGGVASDSPFTLRALVYIVAGHELHHRAVLRDRYLSALEDS